MRSAPRATTPRAGGESVEFVDLGSSAAERHEARFLVVATGTYDEKFVPEVPGMEGFPGKVVHASEYRSAEAEGMKGGERPRRWMRQLWHGDRAGPR